MFLLSVSRCLFQHVLSVAEVRKLLIVLRLLSLGRHRRRCSSQAMASARRLAEPLTEPESDFLGKARPPRAREGAAVRCWASCR